MARTVWYCEECGRELDQDSAEDHAAGHTLVLADRGRGPATVEVDQ